MNGEQKNSKLGVNSNPLAPADQANHAGEKRNNDAIADVPSPQIAAYIANPKISPSAFLKVLRVEKVKRFKKEDEEKAITSLETDDPGGERLWALMSQAKLPDAVDRWIWTAAQNHLRNVVGSSFDPHDTDPSRVLKALRDALSPRLKSKEKSEARSAENWLRIGVCWLVEKRSIQIWSIAELIASMFFADVKGASRLVSRAISKGRTNELKLSVATVVLGNDMVARGRSDLDDERRLSNSLRIQLTNAEKKIDNQSAELAETRAELARSEEALKNIQTQLENERHHWGHDLSETKAEQRVLLGERVAPLLSDAIDALEITPPAPHVALKRIKAVLSIIDEAKQ